MPNPSAESRDLAYEVAPPVGSIIAWHPRLFNAAGNVGVDSADRVTLGACYEYADGSIITAQDSPLKNGAFERKPDITDNRFLMGGSSVTFNGDNYIYGSTNHAGPPIGHSNNGDNSLTIETQALPLHTHEPGTYSVSTIGTTSTDGSHTHGLDGTVDFVETGGGGIGWNSNQYVGNLDIDMDISTLDAGSHSHTTASTGTVSGGLSGDGGFANNIINVLPKYLIVKYIMRVK